MRSSLAGLSLVTELNTRHTSQTNRLVCESPFSYLDVI